MAFTGMFGTARASRRCFGWTRQKPERKAVQRDEEAIHYWLKHRWPYLKRNARRTHRLILFIDETGMYLLPSIVSTWAPRGETPILQEMLSHEHLSVISAVSRHGDIYYAQQAESYDSATVIAFLEAVHQRMPEQKLLVIWDGASIHWGQAIQQYLDEGASAWLLIQGQVMYFRSHNDWPAMLSTKYCGVTPALHFRVPAAVWVSPTGSGAARCIVSGRVIATSPISPCARTASRATPSRGPKR